MKFILQIEVEAPEHTGNPDFPKAVHAIQRLQDWLRQATKANLRYLMNLEIREDSYSRETFLKFKESYENELTLIKKSTLSIKDIT